MDSGAVGEGANDKPGNGWSLFVSQDGYIRLTLAAAISIPLNHICSAFDDDVDLLNQHLLGGICTLKGYTEWASEGVPCLSLGWDWALMSVRGHLLLRRIGSPRTNIQFIDDNGNDFDLSANELLITNLVESILWYPAIQASCGFVMPSEVP